MISSLICTMFKIKNRWNFDLSFKLVSYILLISFPSIFLYCDKGVTKIYRKLFQHDSKEKIINQMFLKHTVMWPDQHAVKCESKKMEIIDIYFLSRSRWGKAGLVRGQACLQWEWKLGWQDCHRLGLGAWYRSCGGKSPLNALYISVHIAGTKG